MLKRRRIAALAVARGRPVARPARHGAVALRLRVVLAAHVRPFADPGAVPRFLAVVLKRRRIAALAVARGARLVAAARRARRGAVVQRVVPAADVRALGDPVAVLVFLALESKRHRVAAVFAARGTGLASLPALVQGISPAALFRLLGNKRAAFAVAVPPQRVIVAFEPPITKFLAHAARV